MLLHLMIPAANSIYFFLDFYFEVSVLEDSVPLSLLSSYYNSMWVSLHPDCLCLARYGSDLLFSTGDAGSVPSFLSCHLSRAPSTFLPASEADLQENALIDRVLCVPAD